MLKLLAVLGVVSQIIISSAHAQANRQPDCDTTNPQVQIIRNDADAVHLNDAAKSIFCIFPGSYNPITLTRDGTSSAPRILRYYNGNQTFTPPWQQSANAQVVIERVKLSADYWSVYGITVRPNPGNEGLIYPFDINGSYNVIDTILNEKGHMLMAFRTGDNNTLQNSVIRQSQRRPGDDSYCIINTRAKHTHILNNEIYDCTDAFQELRNTDWVTYPDWSADGIVIENNEMYQSGSLYANCSNLDANTSLSASGDCSCAEDGIDIKTTTTKSELALSDLTIIRGNILYGFRKTHPSCGGSGSFASGIDLHIDSPKYILIEDNILFDMPQGITMTSVSKITIRDNLMWGINDRGAGQGSIALLANSGNTTEIYHNSIFNSLGNANYLLHNVSATNFDVRNNLFVNAGSARASAGGFGSTSLVGYNGYFDSSAYLSGLPANTNITGSLSNANLGSDYCVTVHKFTNPTVRCFGGVIPRANSPVLQVGDPSLGNRPGIGIDDVTLQGNFLGKFDLVPYISQLLTNWLTSNFDQNGDGSVNSLDFATLWL